LVKNPVLRSVSRVALSSLKRGGRSTVTCANAILSGEFPRRFHTGAPAVERKK
jgi:hypothetical protein